MELKDKKLKKLVDKANSGALYDNIREISIELLDGITEKEFVYDEVFHLLEL